MFVYLIEDVRECPFRLYVSVAQSGASVLGDEDKLKVKQGVYG